MLIAALLAVKLSQGSGIGADYATVRLESGPHLPVAQFQLGAVLVGTGQPVKIRFVRSSAKWANQLFLMKGLAGASLPLFTFSEIELDTQCPEEDSLVRNIGVFAEGEVITLMLKTLKSGFAGAYCTGEACGSRYSGLNDPARSPFYSKGEFARFANHPWASAARLDSAAIARIAGPCPSVAFGERETSGVLMVFDDGADALAGDMIVLLEGAEIAPYPTLKADFMGKAGTGDEPGRGGSCFISASGGGVTRGEAFHPRTLSRPLSVVRLHPDPSKRPDFLDQEWRDAEPKRPAENEFPLAPTLRILTAGAFAFNLAFFTNHGILVNRASGTVSQAMLSGIAPDQNGLLEMGLMWYPVSTDGQRASTGAYIVKGTITPLGWDTGSMPATGACRDTVHPIRIMFGYIRQ